jgi:hypothetical protein
MKSLNKFGNLNKNYNPIFARHESFHPRFGWLKKGFDKYEVFSSEKDRSRAVLGVGQNMVNAIRYWCFAFKILNKDDNTYSRSQFGGDLLDDAGWDPYLEDPATLWLLHWNLFRPPCYATAWYFVFNEFNQHSFASEDLLFSLKEYIKRIFPSKKVTDSSLIKDINCLLRMYVQKNVTKALKEDSIDSPFTGLGLISAYSDSKRYAFNFGSKPTLPYDIIVSACLDFSSRAENSAKTISISRLLYDPGSPGQAFKLTESSLCEAIETVAKHIGKISISNTAGMIQLSYEEDPSELSRMLLEEYYNPRN